MPKKLPPQFDWRSEPDASGLVKAHELLETAPQAAIEKLMALAESGSIGSMLALGWMHYAGIGGAQDLADSEKWSRRAAEAGNPRGDYQLGVLYLRQKRHREAIAAFERSAAGGYGLADRYVGAMYFRGLGTKKDLVKARLHLERAASSGYVHAMRVLSVLLVREGRGIRE